MTSLTYQEALLHTGFLLVVAHDDDPHHLLCPDGACINLWGLTEKNVPRYLACAQKNDLQTAIGTRYTKNSCRFFSLTETQADQIILQFFKYHKWPEDMLIPGKEGKEASNV
ncbi:hypothetical protein [Roseivirga seohaensis]|uniref:hypothetical protein n=1 Tax=Roseivirga seohaensis TaxID=1914963 RepID=UPI003BA8E105